MDHCVLGTGWVGSDTRCLFGSSLDSHSVAQADMASKSVGGGSFQIGRLDGSRAVVGCRCRYGLVSGGNL